MKDKYQVKLHGKEQGRPESLHEALMAVHHSVPGMMPSVKAAMDKGYSIEKVREHKQADEIRHTMGGSHDPYYKTHK